MTDFYKAQSDYWFAESCRRSRLLGSIAACVEATQPEASPYLTPADAVERIRELLAEFNAETERLRGGTR